MFRERDPFFEDELEIDGVYLPKLIREHPGHTPILEQHLKYIEDKLILYKEKHPDHIAQYPPDEHNKHSLDPELCDGHLCRAEWLIYWLGWSLKNCKRPVFVNT